MPFTIVRNNIAEMQADAIVNTANPRVLIGSGVDRELHKKAGRELIAARKNIGDIPVGEAAITNAFNLNAKYVIHTVGPKWKGGNDGEDEAVRNCYLNSLKLAKINNCESIAFPLISTGNYGFPKELALQIAMDSIKEFLESNEMMIYLVVFDSESYKLSGEEFNGIESYIDENYVEELKAVEYFDELVEIRSTEPCSASSLFSEAMPASDTRTQLPNMLDIPNIIFGRKLEDVVDELDETFSETLIRLIDQKGLNDPDVYKKANINRQHFSKIRNNKTYKPTKSTALAFAIALGLNLDETKDLLLKAGYALSHSSLFDVIVEYFIVNGVYDLFEINQALFKYDQPLIGG